MQVHLVLRQPFDPNGVQHNLDLAHVDGQEVDVANAEARLLRDHTGRPLLVGVHRVVAPDVPADEVVHGFHEVQEVDAGQGVQRAVRHPGGDPWAGDVLSAADEEALVRPVLAARAHVLHGEGAVADNAGVLARHHAVVHLVEHAVADLPLERKLVLVGLLPGERKVPRVEHDAGGVEGPLVHRLRVGLELAVLQLRHADVLDRELIPFHLPPVVHLEALHHAAGMVNEVHVLDVRAELHVGQDAVLLADLVEVLQEPVARGPRRVEHRGAGVLLVELQVVGAVLRLQLGGRVCLVHPGRAAYAEHAVEDHEVEVLARREEHGHAQADVAGADDHLRVGVLVRQPLEGLDALDGHLAHDLLVGVHGPVQRPLLRDEADVLRAHGELPGKPLRHLLDGRGALHGHGHLLAGAVDLQRHLEPGRRGLHGARGPPVLVVRERVRRLLRARVDAQHLNAVVPRDGWDRDIHTQGLVWVVLQVLGPFRVEVLRRHGPPHGTAKQQCPGPERGNGLEA
mmetsp:Transcript_66412/g.205749  ORF Transcript_66412/g.205749 Transcript_66412/m.205749 type:complete len:512 (-) Transcript_66412:2-1537(-)